MQEVQAHLGQWTQRWGREIHYVISYDQNVSTSQVRPPRLFGHPSSINTRYRTYSRHSYFTPYILIVLQIFTARTCVSSPSNCLSFFRATACLNNARSAHDVFLKIELSCAPLCAPAINPLPTATLVMDDFTLSLSLASIEDEQTHCPLSFEEPAESSQSPFFSMSLPPVDQEVIHGNGSYSWCTIA